MLTAAESARLDAESPVPVGQLMDRAGLAVALEAVAMGIGAGDRVVVLAGPGNNGGDGYVAAHYLARRGVNVRVESLGMPKTLAAADAGARAAASGVGVFDLDRPRPADLVIDAVFGGGSRHGLPDRVREWMEAACRVLAVDIPTGLDPDTGSVDDLAFRAERTVTFHTPFPGHFLGVGPDHTGRLTVADIGLQGGDPVLRVVEAPDAPRPPRLRTAHKWSAGSVLVVGGGEGMVGAAVMAARAALHFGAGAVGLATPRPDLAQVLAPEILAYPLDALPDRYDVWVVGPGLGLDRGDLVEAALRRGGPVVLDADALTTIDRTRLAEPGAPRILTPHLGEFARLFGQEAPSPARLAEVANEAGSTIVLKGNPTIVTDGSVPWLVLSNGPELATIGSGDVLAGMIAALAARGLDAPDAARSAAYWHGVAAAELARDCTVTADVLARRVGRFAWERS